MTKEKKGNMLIAQSGGPTMVINQSLVGAVLEAMEHPQIGDIYGSLHGIKGIIDEELLDLRAESKETLEAVGRTPSSALGTVRMKPRPDDCLRIFSVLQKYDVRYFFYIGGNDSAETVKIIDEEARVAGYRCRCFHIPKTIDNDLRENDHTPGYGSAAKFVACAVMGDNLDNRALPGIKINVIMGRHAGFLTAASALARVYPDDGPHLIYLPERPFSMSRFVADVQRVNRKYGRCLVAVSEGIADKNGELIAAQFMREVDSHGNIQLSGSGGLGDYLVEQVRLAIPGARARADTFGYLQRSFPDMIDEIDAGEARAVGELAVRHAVKGAARSGSIAIRRKAGKTYEVDYKVVAVHKVARESRHMPQKFINAAGNDVTAAFVDYVRPLVGALPPIGRFACEPIERR